jgi:hypothetical protein
MARPKLADTDKLASLSVRLTQRQMARLERITLADGLPMQDHVRRAVDEYVDSMESSFGLPMLPLGTLPGTAYDLGPDAALPPIAGDAGTQEQPTLANTLDQMVTAGEMTQAPPETPPPVQAPAPTQVLTTNPNQNQNQPAADTLLAGLGVDLPEIDDEA